MLLFPLLVNFQTLSPLLSAVACSELKFFLHEATYQCVGITYRPKTENWFLKSLPLIEHILEYNMLNTSSTAFTRSGSLQLGWRLLAGVYLYRVGISFDTPIQFNEVVFVYWLKIFQNYWQMDHLEKCKCGKWCNKKKTNKYFQKNIVFISEENHFKNHKKLKLLHRPKVLTLVMRTWYNTNRKEDNCIFTYIKTSITPSFAASGLDGQFF